MMIDYNVSSHWPDATPGWLKALTSSLDLHHGKGTVLPLTVIVQELIGWIRFASGEDAWRSRPNRESLSGDLRQSTAAIGATLRSLISTELEAFGVALAHLTGSPSSILKQPPGMRAGDVWMGALDAAESLLRTLATDQATSACWVDLVATVQDESLARREYRPLAELLFEQIKLRGHDPQRVFRELVRLVAYGEDPQDFPFGEGEPVVEVRLAKAKAHVQRAATEEPTTVWLGYRGRFGHLLSAGRVSFYDAHWAVPNAKPGRFEFAHKEELWSIVHRGHSFRVAELVTEKSDVDTLVRVDLGTTASADPFAEATEVVDTILDIAIHRSGGARPDLVEHHVLRSGAHTNSGRHSSRERTRISDDHYGASITTDAIQEHAPRLATALASGNFPPFLKAAIECQTAADRPYSRDQALLRPTDADTRSVIPLTDRVVQHVAAYAGITPDGLFEQLGRRWAHARWHGDLRHATSMCLLGAGPNPDLESELTRELYSERPKQPWILFIAARSEDFLSLCRLEHERAWIARMFRSITDADAYTGLTLEYEAEGAILDARRRRIRNALVHGNPAHLTTVESVQEYAEFTSNFALHLALESFLDATDPVTALTEQTGERAAMSRGVSAADYWSKQVADGTWQPAVS